MFIEQKQGQAKLFQWPRAWQIKNIFQRTFFGFAYFAVQVDTILNFSSYFHSIED